MDSHHRARHLLVDQMCNLAGGFCFYTGRGMKTSHVGLGITEAEWDSNRGAGAGAGRISRAFCAL
jgi:hemoglobin